MQGMALPYDETQTDFGPTFPTSDGRLRYQHRGAGHWRLVAAATGETVGRPYASLRELLADVRAVAAALKESLEEAARRELRLAEQEEARKRQSAARQRRRLRGREPQRKPKAQV
jgi:hypothetical protein